MDYSLFAFITGIFDCIGHMAVCGNCVYSLIILIRIDNKTSDHIQYRHIIEAELIVTMTFNFIMSLASGLMAIGVKKHRHRLVHPWLILTIVWIVGEIIILATTGYVLSLSDIISHVVAIVIQCTVWHPVYHFYKEMDDSYVVLLDSNQRQVADYEAIAARPSVGRYRNNYTTITLM